MKAAIKRPEVRRAILGDYEGGYLLGITRIPEAPEPVIMLRVEGERPREQRTIEVDGKSVEVVVEGGHREVVPLGG